MLTLFKAVVLIIACGGALHAEKIASDLFPLAVGNSWTMVLQAGGTREYVIAPGNKDSLIFIEKINSNGFSRVDTFPLYSYDSLGHFNFPLGRDLSNTLWGPHCAAAKDGPLTTPAGMFPETYIYPLSWGHPSGGNQSVIVSPGIGLLAIAWTSALGCETFSCLEDTFAFLQSYQVVPKPEAAWHDTIPALPGGADFVFSYLTGDSGQVAFKMTQSSFARNMVSSSFNAATGVLRIYLVDTSKIECQSIITAYHSLKLRNLRKDSIYTIAIYSAFFDTSVDLYRDKKYPLKTARNYFERITCASTQIAADRNKIPAKAREVLGVYDISGKLLFKYRQGFPGGRRLPGRTSSGVYIVQSGQSITVIPSIMTRK